MTNTIYFSSILRERYDSSSFSSSSIDGEEVAKLEPEASSPSYTAIGNASLDDSRPPIQIAVSQQPIRTDEEESSQKLYWKFVSLTPQCSVSKCFDLAELKIATRDFCSIAVLEGNHLHKGWVDEHRLTPTEPGMGVAIAVNFIITERLHDDTTWLEEVAYLGYLRHPSLVSLLGYCLEGTYRLLVYEFISQESLDDLFNGLDLKFTWSVWLNVALDIAKGLAFLHSSKVVYGHFTPSNILLDSSYNAKLFGFGFVSNTPTTFPTGVMETPYGDLGYAVGHMTIYDAPEYLRGGYISAKTDVYSFGVVFLEILYGRRAIGNFQPSPENNLVRWIRAHPYLKPKFIGGLDCRTSGQLKRGQAAVQLAQQCASVEVDLRPTMDNVVRSLEKLLNKKDRRAAQMTKLKFSSPSQ